MVHSFTKLPITVPWPSESCKQSPAFSPVANWIPKSPTRPSRGIHRTRGLQSHTESCHETFPAIITRKNIQGSPEFPGVAVIAQCYRPDHSTNPERNSILIIAVSKECVLKVFPPGSFPCTSQLCHAHCCRQFGNSAEYSSSFCAGRVKLPICTAHPSWNAISIVANPTSLEFAAALATTTEATQNTKMPVYSSEKCLFHCCTLLLISFLSLKGIAPALLAINIDLLPQPSPTTCSPALSKAVSSLSLSTQESLLGRVCNFRAPFTIL